MQDCNHNKHPLERSGTSQAERLLPGLRKDYVQVDERNHKDWIVFARKFSSYITYFDNNNLPAGNWSPFFSNDIAAALAAISIQDVELYRRMVKEKLDFLKTGHKPDANAAMRITFTELFSAIGTLSLALDEQLERLPGDHSFTLLIKNLISVKLSPALQRLVGFYRAARVLALTAPLPDHSWIILDKPLVEFEQVNTTGLGKHWYSSIQKWDANEPGPDYRIFGAATTDKIFYAAYHNMFTSVFDTYLTIYTRINLEAGKELQKKLEVWPSHQPHYALFLSFLKLFQEAGNSLNTLTGRHLKFYYKEILKLEPKKAEPDFANIIVSLARHATSFVIKKDTLFRGGKDSTGADRYYRLLHDTSFNHAAAVSFKAVFKAAAADNITTGTTKIINKGRLYASPVINSDDGLGKELSSPNGDWHPFAQKRYKDGMLQEIAMPQARIGCAIASHQLLLAEGDRSITITIAGEKTAALDGKKLVGWLSVQKGWYRVALQGSKTTMDGKVAVAYIISLSSEAPAITPYSEAVHQAGLQTVHPALSIELEQKNEEQYLYDDVKDIEVSSIHISVKVGIQKNADDGFQPGGLRQLMLSNDFGPIDPAKPFQPFGPFPSVGSSLVIGSPEAFTKENIDLRLNLQWKDLPDDKVQLVYRTPLKKQDTAHPGKVISETVVVAPVATLQFLSGTWQDKTNGPLLIINKNGNKGETVYPAQYVKDVPVAPAGEGYRAYGTASKSGFLKVRLDTDFGFEAYQNDLTAYLIDKANKVPNINAPVKPYVPALLSLTLSYASSTSEKINSTGADAFTNRTIQFFHAYPFGAVEHHGYLVEGEKTYLFPQFAGGTGDDRRAHVAEFYMGFEKLKAGDAVQVLFQVLEGSANPLAVKPDNHLRWSCLCNNRWRDFVRTEISDATTSLARTGIISFAIPPEATTDNLVLPPGLLWIRAGIVAAVDAVSKLLGVYAQAAMVTLDRPEGRVPVATANLPAGTISKLKHPLSEVKKVVQPFPSFGGRPGETNDQYYVRVSERLRHKGRAITIWDYEHMVLEAFPQIHKVKCLSHTMFEQGVGSGSMEYNEGKPGYVCIIPIPSLASRNDANPLQPFTPQSLLQDIESYLNKRISAHATIRVRNPLFETVSLSFEMQLAPGYQDFNVYANQLKEEITRFLSPWAYNQGGDIQFGGTIYKSTLINFIEERDYVDFITCVKMFHSLNPEENVEEIKASTARSILVSVPAKDHIVGPITIHPKK